MINKNSYDILFSQLDGLILTNSSREVILLEEFLICPFKRVQLLRENLQQSGLRKEGHNAPQTLQPRTDHRDVLAGRN